MTLSRRAFLAVPLALGTVGFAGFGPGEQGRPAMPLMILRSVHPFDAPFAAGAAAGLALLGLPPPVAFNVSLTEATLFTRLREAFRSGPGRSVIGLMEHGPALLVEQALLDRRAAMIWTSGHTWVNGTLSHSFAGRRTAAPTLAGRPADWPYRLGHSLSGAGAPHGTPVPLTPTPGRFTLTSFAAIL